MSNPDINAPFIHDMLFADASVVQAVQRLVNANVRFAVCLNENDAPVAYVESQEMAELILAALAKRTR